MNEVNLTKNAQKDLMKSPREIVISFARWQRIVTEVGVAGLKKIKGYHDESLKGERKGQRSSRLNKAWRVIYRVKNDHVEIIDVLEVNKHDY